MNILAQYNTIIYENVQSYAVKKVVKYLNKFYSPVDEIYPVGNEFITKRMIKKLVDNDVIKPIDLLKYLKTKFTNYDDNFLKQIIIDWSDGNIIHNYKLSKNIKM